MPLLIESEINFSTSLEIFVLSNISSPDNVGQLCIIKETFVIV